MFRSSLRHIQKTYMFNKSALSAELELIRFGRTRQYFLIFPRLMGRSRSALTHRPIFFMPRSYFIPTLMSYHNYCLSMPVLIAPIFVQINGTTLSNFGPVLSSTGPCTTTTTTLTPRCALIIYHFNKCLNTSVPRNLSRDANRWQKLN